MRGNGVIAEIADQMGYSVQTIRVWLQSGKCPYGSAFKKPGSQHYTYIIYPEALAKLGIKKSTEPVGSESVQK